MAKIVRLLLISVVLASFGSASAQNLPRGFEAPVPPAPIIEVQTVDQSVRIGQLEDQVRQLTGRLEELGFQMLQMQEQVRQMQQDNEFRFQELERSSGTDQTSIAPKSNRASSSNVTEIKIGDAKFDANGNLINQKEVEIAAAAPSDELYKSGYGHILAGDYSLAANSFRDYIEQYPNGEQAADAYFWLGEALYSEGEYKEAARTFLEAHKSHPNADKGPDTLLKLGMSLAALENFETACATYQEVLARYPNASKAIRDKVASEQSSTKC